MEDEKQPTGRLTNKNSLPPITPKTHKEETNVDKIAVSKRRKKQEKENSQIAGEDEKMHFRNSPPAMPYGKCVDNNGSYAQKIDKSVKPTTTEKSVGKKPINKLNESDRSVSIADNGTIASVEERGRTKQRTKRRKVRKAHQGDDDTSKNTGNNYITCEQLCGIEDDVVGVADCEQGIGKLAFVTMTSASVLQSQPVNKMFFETTRGFKGMSKKQLRKLAQQDKFNDTQPEQSLTPFLSTLQFGLQTHQSFQKLCLFLHGVTSGLTLWHVVVVHILLDFGDADFLVRYRSLALSIQALLYILFSLCLVSACDRFDIANPTYRFINHALTLQNGAVSIVFYLAALVFSLSCVGVEDRVHLQDKHPDLWNSTEVTRSELKKFNVLNTARGVASVLGWLAISLSLTTDRLSANLMAGDDEMLSGDLEMKNHQSA